MTQEHAEKNTSKATEKPKGSDPKGLSPESKAKNDAVKADTDAILDDIDNVLGDLTDEQAQEWVENFRQKGGE